MSAHGSTSTTGRTRRRVAHRGARVLGAALSTALVALAVQLGGPSAGAVSFGWQPLGQVGAWPSNATFSVTATGTAVSCGTLGDCVGVGWYYATVGLNSYEEPMVFQLVNGIEQQPQEITVPSDAAANPAATLTGVSCPKPSFCTAVGSYTRSDSTVQAMVVTEVAGSWGQAASLPEPSDAHSGDAQVKPSAISCWSVGSCVSVGDYVTGSGHNLPLIEVETSGTWSALSSVSVPLGNLDFANLTGVSCAAASSCTAVGVYNNPSDEQYGFEISDAGGFWGSATALVPPADALAGAPAEQPSGVSCWSASNCMITGQYATGVTGWLSFGQQELNGVFGAASSLPAASNEFATRYDQMSSISCPAAGVCIAVGNYWDDQGTSVQHGFIEVYQYGVWFDETMQDPPEFVQSGALNGVACAPSGSCVSTGGYSDGGATLEMHAKLYSLVAAVSSQHVTQTGAHTALFSWVPPTVVGAGVKSYIAEISGDGGSHWTELPFPLTGPPATSAPATGLVAHHAYEVEVYSISTLNQALPSPIVHFTQGGPPTAPRSPHTAPTHLGATVAWSPPASNGGLAITKYTVTLTAAGAVRTISVPGGVTHLVVVGLVHTKTYSVVVTASNLAGVSPLSPTTHVTPLA